MLLFGPDVGDGDVEAVHGVDEFGQPRLQRLPSPALRAAHPIGELRDDDGAGVAAVLFPLQPGEDAWVSVSLGGLAKNVGVEQPAHN